MHYAPSIMSATSIDLHLETPPMPQVVGISQLHPSVLAFPYQRRSSVGPNSINIENRLQIGGQQWLGRAFAPGNDGV